MPSTDREKVGAIGLQADGYTLMEEIDLGGFDVQAERVPVDGYVCEEKMCGGVKSGLAGCGVFRYAKETKEGGGNSSPNYDFVLKKA